MLGKAVCVFSATSNQVSLIGRGNPGGDTGVSFFQSVGCAELSILGHRSQRTALVKPLIHPTLLAMLAMGLGACVGTAGISTWEYQSGPGFQKERIDEKRISGDTVRGIESTSCSSVISRQVGPSGQISGSETTLCAPGLSVQSYGGRNEPLP
jgi:hypothetical protein